MVNDTTIDPAAALELTRDAGIRSFAALPMIAQGTTMGVLAAGSYHPHRFSDGVLDFLRAVANQAASWLEHHRLLEELRRREHDARLIADLGEMLNRSRGPDSIARRLTRHLTDALDRTVAIFPRTPDATTWEITRVAYARGANRRAIAATVRRYAAGPPGDGWPGRVRRRRCCSVPMLQG